MPRFGDPEPLGSDHVLSGFECGVDSLNTWLPKHARAAAASGSARTYVIADAEQERVVGYHALCAASVSRQEASPRASRGMPRHPIPALLLARLAVDQSVQGNGLGAFLLRDAMARTLAAASEFGIRIMLVHALNEPARDFYLHHGFEPSRTDPMNLQLLVKDIEASPASSTSIRYRPAPLRPPCFNSRPKPKVRLARRSLTAPTQSTSSSPLSSRICASCGARVAAIPPSSPPTPPPLKRP